MAIPRATVQAWLAKAAAKPSKYKNVKTEVDGIQFDSKKEAARYVVLKAKLNNHEIAALTLQKVYPLEVNRVKIGKYVADFVYQKGPLFSETVVEDCKGFLTPVYRLKRKLMKAIYGIDIVEI